MRNKSYGLLLQKKRTATTYAGLVATAVIIAILCAKPSNALADTLVYATLSSAQELERIINVSITVQELQNEEQQNYPDDGLLSDSVCNISLGIRSDKLLYDSGEKIEFYNTLSALKGKDGKTVQYSIEYWIEDLFGNIVKKPVITSNLNKKSYTPKINEPDRVFVIKSRIEWISCNNTCEKTSAMAFVIVKGEDAEYACECECDDEQSSESGSQSSTSTVQTTTGKLSYELLNYPAVVHAGESFNITVRVNNSATETSFSVYSYVYRGSVSYSGEREANMESAVLPAFGSHKFVQQINPNADIGMYKLKVRIRREGIKTESEITRDIEIVEKKKGTENGEAEEGSEAGESKADDDSNDEGSMTGKDSGEISAVGFEGTSGEKDALSQGAGLASGSMANELVTGSAVAGAVDRESADTIYSSASGRAKAMIPYVIIASLSMACVVAIWKKD